MKKIIALLLSLLFCFGSLTLAEESWNCAECGMANNEKFCEYCGAEKPEEWLWTCPGCGRQNDNKFCPACGVKRPVPTWYASVSIRDCGTVTIRLEAEKAPITTKNFVELAEKGFYDGLTFHRIIAGFMMQGGDPNGDGTGGSGKNIKGEFAANGIDTGLSHTRGAVSMARSQIYDSASSQFFIMHQDYPYLDGQYAVFGYVIDGIDIIDKICTEAQPTDNNGSIAPEQQPVIEKVTVWCEKPAA